MTDGNVNPFAKPKLKLTEEQRRERSERAKARFKVAE